MPATVSENLRPTVIAGLDNTARVAREEIFGPVLVVIAHDGDDDAVRIANDSAYGLSGSVDSGSLERAKAVAARIGTAHPDLEELSAAILDPAIRRVFLGAAVAGFLLLASTAFMIKRLPERAEG